MLGECPNVQGGTATKIRANGPKTGNSLVMHAGKCEIPDQKFLENFPSYLVLDIQLQFYCIIRKYSLKSENVD